jgi:hypothetical protein
MSSFSESRLGKRQFDCSEAEQGAERQLPFIDQSPSPKNKTKKSVMWPWAPGEPGTASLQAPVHCVDALQRPGPSPSIPFLNPLSSVAGFLAGN